MRLAWIVVGLALLTAPIAGTAASGDETSTQDASPHVIVGVPDSGINPYHEAFYKPNEPQLKEHPCSYIPKFPCDLQKLNLSLQLAQDEGFETAFQADQDKWDSLQPNTWYWIPQTPFVAVMCEPESQRGSAVDGASQTCILDDGTSHGTATTYSVIEENPDALIAFKQGGASVQPILDKQIPVDVFSVSFGYVAPLPLPHQAPGLYVKAAGNDPRPITADAWSGNPGAIAVGGAYKHGLLAEGGESEILAAKQPDVVGPYCRQAANAQASEGTSRNCGTSFAAPTTAGALSKVILDLRRHSNYTGNSVNGFVDPTQGITRDDLRTAMNWTATYDPQGEGTRSTTGVPTNPAAPWLQWGWGYYDESVTDATLAHLLGNEQDKKPEQARTYMHTVYDARVVYQTSDPTFAPDAEFDVFCNGLACQFDASESHDEQTPDAELSYHWDFGDGTTATGIEVNHTYDTVGSTNVTLTVSDGTRTDQEIQRVVHVPDTELSLTPVKQNFGIDEPVRLNVLVTAESTGEGVAGVPVNIEAIYESGSPIVDTFLTAPLVKTAGKTGELVHHETRVKTGADGTAIATIPGETDATGERTNAPTPTGQYLAKADVDLDSVFTFDDTTYTVGPQAPGS